MEVPVERIPIILDFHRDKEFLLTASQRLSDKISLTLYYLTVSTSLRRSIRNLAKGVKGRFLCLGLPILRTVFSVVSKDCLRTDLCPEGPVFENVKSDVIPKGLGFTIVR